MTAYPDTSFLCCLYRKQAFSAGALAYRKAMSHMLQVTELLHFEFIQAIELQVFLHARDRSKGYSHADAQAISDRWNHHLSDGSVKIVGCDMDAVIRHAQQITLGHTATGGHRSLDVLHVATAIHLGAKEFLSFDQRQIALARSLGLGTPFA
jgi:predicted nucleic acid-binding protein